MVAVISITITADNTAEQRIGRAKTLIAQMREMWYNPLQHLSLEEEKMRWYPVEFVAHFPEPLKRTKKIGNSSMRTSVRMTVIFRKQ